MTVFFRQARLPRHTVPRNDGALACPFFAYKTESLLNCTHKLQEKIMSAVTFDTLKFVERLKASGVSDVQAKAMAEAQVEAFPETTSNTLATKQDVTRLELKMVEHDGEFKLIKWMMGLLLGGVAALVLKAFF
jgi:hypothetical protein